MMELMDKDGKFEGGILRRVDTALAWLQRVSCWMHGHGPDVVWRDGAWHCPLCGKALKNVELA